MRSISRLKHTFHHHKYTYSTTINASNDILQMAQGVLSGDRRQLSRAITLIESTHPSHSEEAQTLLSYIFQHKNKQNKSFRIGITGPPGAGKSTFVNELGTNLCSEPYNKHISVLPIDPSSFLSGGSILGDQTRMLDLFKQSNAFLRPSPNRLSLGGVTDTTFEVCTLCESAGFDTIFVETVGVGQAEIEVAHCVDMFILILTPSSGDDLQGLKRGIMEMADLIIVNKAEGEMINAAKHIKSDYQRALGLTQTRRANIGWMPKIVLCSSLSNTIKDRRKNDGDHEKKKKVNTVLDVWNEIGEFKEKMEQIGEFERCRRQQSKHAMWKYVWRDIRQNVDAIRPKLSDLEERVMSNDISPREAAKSVWKSMQ